MGMCRLLKVVSQGMVMTAGAGEGCRSSKGLVTDSRMFGPKGRNGAEK